MKINNLIKKAVGRSKFIEWQNAELEQSLHQCSSSFIFISHNFMKSFLLLLLAIFITQSSFGQWQYSGNNAYLLNGNVGIGTNNPQAALHVYGTTSSVSIQSTGGDNTNTELDLMGGSNNAGWAIGTNKSSVSGLPDNLFFYKLFGTAGPKMVITDLGHVGIGTLSPSTLLVVNNTTGNAQVTIQNNQSVTSDLILENSSQSYECGLNAWGVAGFNIADATLGQIRFSIQNTTGNIGIGTVNPGNYKLAVNGSIHTQLVQVDMTGWSDYVFDPEYHLQSLSYLKSYVQQFHHLPEIPSEREVIKNGINLGEMVKLQTKKIEELTLYLIEKDKQVKDQQTELDDQKKEILDLKQKVEKLLRIVSGK